MPVEGNMGPIMRLQDPKAREMQLPKAEAVRDQKHLRELQAARPGGAVVMGKYMTRADLLDSIRAHQAEEQRRREYVPPPPPPTNRQRRQIEEEQEAGRRRVAFYEAQRRNAGQPVADDPGKPMAVPADGEGSKDRNPKSLQRPTSQKGTTQHLT